MKLNEIIEKTIMDYRMSNIGDVNFIVMHPKTWRDLVLEYTDKNFYSDIVNVKYRGYQVLRSLDVDEGIFRI